MAANIPGTSHGQGRTERRALYPGSFDPVTRGHLDVIFRAAALFDRLLVGVVENPAKSPLFSLEERVSLLRAELESLSNVEVDSFRGLSVELAVQQGARWIVRGFRSSGDADSELAMAHSNARLSEAAIDTVLVPAAPEVAFVRSGLVREIAALGGDLSSFVTARVAEALRGKAVRR